MYKFTYPFLFAGMFFGLNTLIVGHVLAAEVDPTSPFHHSTSPLAIAGVDKMVLESIIHGVGIQTVVINGKVLKLLDYIGEYQLIAVNAKNVTLRSKTESLNLSMFKSNIIKKSVTK